MDEFVWVYQTNDTWTPFPDRVSSSIEKAFRYDLEEKVIDGVYRISLKCLVQDHIDDRRRQRIVDHDGASKVEWQRAERFSFLLGLGSGSNACVDTDDYGSPFIQQWFLAFTKGERTIKFDSIFPFLVQGLQKEGESQAKRVVEAITGILYKVRDENHRKNEHKRMKMLENCCAELYTKPCFIYRIVNTALRDDDHTKLDTLGPYCFLVFNYIGRRINDGFSTRYPLRNAFRLKRTELTTVFRGDWISSHMIKEYRGAVGDDSKSFKWLSFASTSYDRTVAEVFVQNVLYVIRLENDSFSDQSVDLSTTSSCEDEKEVLLQPGVRLQVVEVDFDHPKSFYSVYITILPSYVSRLK